MGIENLLDKGLNKLDEEDLEKIWDIDFCDGTHGERIGIINECKEYSEMYAIIGGDEVRFHEHRKREEFYSVIEGQGNLRIGDEVKCIERGNKFHIGKEIAHSLERISGAPLILKVVCYPKYDASDVIYSK